MTVERVQDRTQEFLGRMMGALADYKWKKNEIVRLEEKLFGTGQKVSFGVAQYGIEMAMPKGSSGKSITEMKDLDRLEKRKINNFMEMKAEVEVVKSIEGIDYVMDNVYLATIYDLALEGKSMREIGKRVCMDRRTVTKHIEDIFKVAMQTELVETWLIYGVVDVFD